MGGDCGVGNTVGISVTYRTSGVEVGVTVGGTSVRVGALVAVAFPPCSGRVGPQAPARSATRMTKVTIAIRFDPLIRENISTTK